MSIASNGCKSVYLLCTLCWPSTICFQTHNIIRKHRRVYASYVSASVLHAVQLPFQRGPMHWIWYWFRSIMHTIGVQFGETGYKKYIKYGVRSLAAPRNAVDAGDIAALAGLESRIQRLITLRDRCIRPVRCIRRARNRPRTRVCTACTRSDCIRTCICRHAAPRTRRFRIRPGRSAYTGRGLHRSPICTRIPRGWSNRRSPDTGTSRRACRRHPRRAIPLGSCRCSVLCSDPRNNRYRNAARTDRLSRCADSLRNSPGWWSVR